VARQFTDAPERGALLRKEGLIIRVERSSARWTFFTFHPANLENTGDLRVPPRPCLKKFEKAGFCRMLPDI
jgi:hypothetical protein